MDLKIKPEAPTWTKELSQKNKNKYALSNKVENSVIQNSGDDQKYDFKFTKGIPKIILTSKELIEFLSSNASQISFEINFTNNQFSPASAFPVQEENSKTYTSTAGEIIFKKSHKDKPEINVLTSPMTSVDTTPLTPVTPTIEKIKVVTGNWLNKQAGGKYGKGNNADSLYIINNDDNLTNLNRFIINTETEMDLKIKPEAPTWTKELSQKNKNKYALSNKVENSVIQNSGDDQKYDFKFTKGIPKIILTSKELIEFLSSNALQISFEINFTNNQFSPASAFSVQQENSKTYTSPGQIEIIF